jgi:hypothetical protein
VSTYDRKAFSADYIWTLGAFAGAVAAIILTTALWPSHAQENLYVVAAGAVPVLGIGVGLQARVLSVEHRDAFLRAVHAAHVTEVARWESEWIERLEARGEMRTLGDEVREIWAKTVALGEETRELEARIAALRADRPSSSPAGAASDERDAAPMLRPEMVAAEVEYEKSLDQLRSAIDDFAASPPKTLLFRASHAALVACTAGAMIYGEANALLVLSRGDFATSDCRSTVAAIGVGMVVILVRAVGPSQFRLPFDRPVPGPTALSGHAKPNSAGTGRSNTAVERRIGQ